MSAFRINEIQFSDPNNREEQPDSLGRLNSKFGLNFYRYPSELGSSRYNHYMLFEVFVRENINQDFGTQITGEDPLDYTIRKALSRSRGSGGNVADIYKQAVDPLIGNFLKSATSDQLSDSSNSNFDPDDELNIRGSWDNEPALTSLYDDPSLFPGAFGDEMRARARTSTLANRLFQQLKTDLAKSFNTLKKAKESIALYMPDTLNFDYQHNYNDLALSDNPLVMAAQAMAAGASAIGPRKDVSGLSAFISEAISSLGGAGLPGSLEAVGLAVNPQFEVVFQSTSLRSFQFDFMFYPREEREAENVQKIINAFKFHAAPEILAGGGGRYLLAPSAFDISFFYNGQINPNIPRISTCVCTAVQTDYAPNGFSTYELQNQPNPRLGRTGMPVAIRMQLQFKEMTLITKELLRGSTLNSIDRSGATF